MATALLDRELDRLIADAVAAQRAGNAEQAERGYRSALAAQPTHPEANHNLAIMLIQSGRASEALNHFRTAIEQDAERELYWLSYARALLLTGDARGALFVLEEDAPYICALPAGDALAAQARQSLQGASKVPAAHLLELAERQAEAMTAHGDFVGAATRLRHAINRRPANRDRLLLQLGNALIELDRRDEAVTAYRDAIALTPGLAEAHHHLGSILSESDEVAAGFEHFMKRARLVHAEPAGDASPELVHKTKHDAEQRAHLIATGITDATAFTTSGGDRLPGPALNPANACCDLKRQWEAASPQLLVIDDFLLPEALEKLRAFCANSTVWKRVYSAGYIGATPEDGFACPLLAQIVEEVGRLYAPILAPYPFRYLGGFKYDSEHSTGTNTHADFSAINVNLYITPDEANLDRESGGMVVWDLAAKSESELRDYNGNEAKLDRLIETTGVAKTRIPHRANRAVIFASSLFHRTDDCTFAEGYLNKRINISLLYGDWQAGRF